MLNLFDTAPVFTWANKPAASAMPGKVIRVSNIGPAAAGSFFISDGTRWTALNGQTVIDRDSVARGVAPSGTIGTGSSGNLTLGTALPRVYSEGIWLYLPAIATTPSIAAGMYYVVMSSSTVGTIYSNGPGSAALSISSGASFTGSTGAVSVRSVTVPAGCMGINGQIRASAVLSHANSAGAKNIRLKFGGSVLIATSPSTTLSTSLIGRIANKGAANVQIGQGSWLSGSAGSVVTSASVDTTADVTLLLELQLATATDYVVIENSSMELIT